MDCFLAQEYLFRSNIFSGQDETVAVQELLQAGGCGRTRPSTASPCPGRHRYISLPVAHFNQGSSFFHSLMMVFTGVFGFECSLKSVLLCAESRHIRHIGEFLCQKKWGFWFFLLLFLQVIEHFRACRNFSWKFYGFISMYVTFKAFRKSLFYKYTNMFTWKSYRYTNIWFTFKAFRKSLHYEHWICL